MTRGDERPPDDRDDADRPGESDPVAPSSSGHGALTPASDSGPTDVTPGNSPDRPWWGEPWHADGPGDTSAESAAVPHETRPFPAYDPVGTGSAGDSSAAARGHRRRGALWAVMALVGIVLFTGIGAAIGVHVGENRHSGGSDVSLSKPSTASAPVVNSNGTTSIESVAAAVQPVVVSISETTSQLEGTGSGVVIDATRGYILTNNHVVSASASGAGKITVTTNDGREAPAKIVGRDPTSDIAVIQIQLDNLTQAQLGNSSSLKVGQTVVAFGSPLGLQGTVTSGIVSALDRPVSTQDTDGSSGTGTQATIDAIQTDAAINPGNSGGPLVDGGGKVIGINSAIASTGSSDGQTQSGSIGVGFAIPINEAINVAQQIIRTGHAVHPVIGASISDTTDGTSGAIIRQLTSDGPAQAAGLRVGDRITQIDGKDVADSDAAVVALRKDHNPGDEVKVTYVRDGSTDSATVKLAASDPSP